MGSEMCIRDSYTTLSTLTLSEFGALSCSSGAVVSGYECAWPVVVWWVMVCLELGACLILGAWNSSVTPCVSVGRGVGSPRKFAERIVERSAVHRGMNEQFLL